MSKLPVLFSHGAPEPHDVVPAPVPPRRRGGLRELLAAAFEWLWRPAAAPKPPPSFPGDGTVPIFVVHPPPAWHRPGEPLIGRPLTLSDQLIWAYEEAVAAGQDPTQAMIEVVCAPRMSRAGQAAGTQPKQPQGKLEVRQRPAIEGRRRDG
jgi:hypothetical protein